MKAYEGVDGGGRLKHRMHTHAHGECKGASHLGVPAIPSLLPQQNRMQQPCPQQQQAWLLCRSFTTCLTCALQPASLPHASSPAESLTSWRGRG
eukprot:scaffold21286_cov73-Isochrysis_galbana.AAC.1